ncbi:protein FAR1-RELATED SEQUENCE 5-like [Helianthus annuus]|uniref:protein FAR1-RELATED SEQUENCE 5-like n=1 Tax=Helianthus annuus TaxID=4232 RepID=UPI000B8F5D5E|nr:protein FAR1-RELATED SEQUENCE 5-like [Helianthus annuus]
MIRIKLNDAKKYELYHFTEAHNHDFVHEEDLDLRKENRCVNRAHEEMINKMSNLNIGPVRAFNIMKKVCGGFDKVGATEVDFKNFKKELNLFIEEFDAEMYNMMFVPFTGIDNNNRNITLGAAILGSETAETYGWLLKVGATLCSNTDFRKRLSAVVWTDSLLPEAFETEWAAILNEFGLTDHEWLTYIYGLRESWIPAYYREEEMSGLMRTSSRSESENHFFGKISNPKCTLVEFLSHFDTVIEAQRHEHRKNDHDTRYTNPEPWSEFVLEKQAVQIHTRTIFFDVQLEIQHAIHRCTSVRLGHPSDLYTVFFGYAMLKVMIREEDVTIKCNCNRILDVREFPRQYILRRWMREVMPNSSPRSILTDGGDPDRSEEVNRCVREISHATEYVVNKLISKFDQLCTFREHIKQFMSVTDEAQINAPLKTRRNRFAELLGVAPVSTTTIRVPVGTRFKGCGSHKRLKSQKERTISQSGSTSRDAEGNAATTVEAAAATIVEGDGPGSNDVDDVFYTSGNDADLDDEDMAE